MKRISILLSHRGKRHICDNLIDHMAIQLIVINDFYNNPIAVVTLPIPASFRFDPQEADMRESKMMMTTKPPPATKPASVTVWMKFIFSNSSSHNWGRYSFPLESCTVISVIMQRPNFYREYATPIFDSSFFANSDLGDAWLKALLVLQHILYHQPKN